MHVGTCIISARLINAFEGPRLIDSPEPDEYQCDAAYRAQHCDGNNVGCGAHFEAVM